MGGLKRYDEKWVGKRKEKEENDTLFLIKMEKNQKCQNRNCM